MKTGILLVNLGTPNSPAVPDVRVFLREFLMDPLVVDLPFLPRWLLVNLIIAPFRAPKSAKEYQALWTEQGSPLKFHTEALAEKLQAKIGEQFELAWAMRYQQPSIEQGLSVLKQKGCEQLLILPLFPQYAEATNRSVFDEVDKQLAKLDWQPQLKRVHSFPTYQPFIDAIIERTKDFDIESYDHVLFSYHGLPERQLKKLGIGCLEGNCCAELTAKNHGCYRAQCFATTRALAKELGLAEQKFSICFQSRQGRIPWLQPYTEDVIDAQAEQGAKRLLVLSPAFVADCLETTIEIAHGYHEQFVEQGGQQLDLVPSLNATDPWVSALYQLILQQDLMNDSTKHN